MTRRGALLALPAACAACRRRQAFTGYAFVANHDGRAVAAVDLGVFAVAKHIPLDGEPTAVIAGPESARLWALTPGNGRIHEIAIAKLAVARSTAVADRAVSMRLENGARRLWVLSGQPRQLSAVSTATLQTEWNLPLPADPFDFDISADGRWIAISYGAAGFLQLADLAARRLGTPIPASAQMGLVRFQWDSTQLIAANLEERMLNIYQTATGRLVVKLPLAVRPDRFCFNSDGGQLFVTGEGMDAVVVVYPYFTPQVGETVLAGRAPGAMAATTELLFVANSRSGDVSILSVETARVMAVAPAGSDPSFIAITPDNQYALVLNETSGDMAVIWIPSITRTRARTAALFTMIQVGSRPVSAAVVRI